MNLIRHVVVRAAPHCCIPPTYNLCPACPTTTFPEPTFDSLLRARSSLSLPCLKLHFGNNWELKCARLESLRHMRDNFHRVGSPP